MDQDATWYGVRRRTTFVTARAMLALQALYCLATASPSVRPSVRPSVTRRYCVKTTAHSTVQFTPIEIEKEVQLRLTRTRHGLSNEPSTEVLYAAPNFLKMGIKMPISVVFWTTST